jgi:hypothetical protein
MITDHGHPADDFVQHGGDDPTMDDAWVALIRFGHRVFRADLVFAIVNEPHVKAAGVLAAANKTIIGVGLDVIHNAVCPNLQVV